MIDRLLSFIAPHHCCGCDETGTLLCNNCKYDIISEPYSACVACGVGLGGKQGLCKNCIMPYERAWCVAPRSDSLQRLIDIYKFANAKAGYKSLASLLHEHLPELPSDVRLVSIPTVSSHIRQRGYDHMHLITGEFSKLRGLSVDTPLRRITNTSQRGAGKSIRNKQARMAFVTNELVDPDCIYLLLDDVMTTGATMKYAAKSLKDAGAKMVWIATISRQPLD